MAKNNTSATWSKRLSKAVRRPIGGVHPDDQKAAQAVATETLPVPPLVKLAVTSVTPAGCQLLVKPGDQVAVGQPVASPVDRMSVPLHASVSGQVLSADEAVNINGQSCPVVVIASDGRQTPWEQLAPPQVTDFDSFRQAVRASGVLGLGGAGFPAFFKLGSAPDQRIDLLVANGSECEPYSASDAREMLENGAELLAGIRAVLDYGQIDRAIIGIEGNKPEAIRHLSELIGDDERICVRVLPRRYPQGGEKQLVYAVSGRKIAGGALPSAVGALVMNVSSLAAIAVYLKTGQPLTQRRITVTGPAFDRPRNLMVPVGTPVSQILTYAGGLNGAGSCLIQGGPMMGRLIEDYEAGIMKTTNLLLGLTAAQTKKPAEQACIRCGLCAEVCPMRLQPSEMNQLVLLGRYQEAAERYYMKDCIECGCCSFVCPAYRLLTQSFVYGKQQLRSAQQQTQGGQTK
ncbi:electron transport complex subunit RsxC [Oscillospiraceae bacterium HV4-5-C5C]|nr:electron transport complex subunit RsxC [Oscillospiraceae bacterium HV4-5-C5C]